MCVRRGERKRETYARAVCAVTLVADGTFADDGAVGVGVGVALDVAGAAAAVRDGCSGHGTGVGRR